MQKIRHDIYEMVNEYTELHQEQSMIAEKLKALKGTIKEYMEDNNMKQLEGDKGTVKLQDANKSNSTSLYNDYELSDVMTVLRNEHLKLVTEIRVNTKKLEGLIASEILPKQQAEAIKELKKVQRGNPRFTVKR